LHGRKPSRLNQIQQHEHIYDCHITAQEKHFQPIKAVKLNICVLLHTTNNNKKSAAVAVPL
jgi:hypothetical protein